MAWGEGVFQLYGSWKRSGRESDPLRAEKAWLSNDLLNITLSRKLIKCFKIHLMNIYLSKVLNHLLPALF
jgi:hypothetical protein